MLDYRAHTFLEVYRQRSFTRAAAALLITQPAASQHVRQLEAHYGCPLFRKTGRGIEPTSAAKILYRSLLTMENDERRTALELEALAGDHGGSGTPPLRFGCTRTIADHVAPAFLTALLARMPATEVLMQSDNTRALVQALDRGQIDFALVEGSFDRARFAWERLSTEAYAAVAAPGTPRAASVEELLAHRLILREQGSGTREILEKHLAARDLSITDFAGTMELGSIPTIKACVAAGAGISFMYRIAAQSELDAGTLSEITPPDLHIEHDFRLIWQRGSHFADRYRALARFGGESLPRG